jgi:hypothetical protein
MLMNSISGVSGQIVYNTNSKKRSRRSLYNNHRLIQQEDIIIVNECIPNTRTSDRVK